MTRRRVLGWRAGLAALALAAGCQTLTGPHATSTGGGDDAWITAFVKTRLVAEKATNLTRIDVDTTRGTVYLTGAIDTDDQRARAEQFAWQAKGVKEVVNALRVVDQR